MALITKPHGGYRLLSIDQLCVAWCAYRSGALSWMAFRVFLALQEVAERRKAANRPGVRRSEGLWLRTVVLELMSLIACARTSQVRVALSQLEGVGLVRQGEGLIELVSRVHLTTEARAMFEQIGRRGNLPVPRQVLRYLASGASTAVAAYMLGIVIRCCRIGAGGEYKARGRCSTRFVAELFGLHHRTVKRAVANVVLLGWIVKECRADRWTRRYGPVVRVNTDWRSVDIKPTFCLIDGDTETPPQEITINTGLPPVMNENRTESPPLNRKQELLTDPKNQEPAVVPRAGSVKSESTPTASRSPRLASPVKPGTSRRPALHSLSMDDLRDAARLGSRYRVAVGDGLIEESPAARLRFFAAAQHALRVGTRNPCGLFATVVRRGLWSHVSQVDEDRAKTLLAQETDPAGQKKSGLCSDKRIRDLIQAVAGKVSWPAAQVATKSCTTVATSSKNLAGRASPTPWSSAPMACSASTTESTFSSKAA